jgi:nitroimidazol reductase NimA-like FMN-containing flavoprotein (pyridoxamine 5'-phosphate oxidase superfamily)
MGDVHPGRTHACQSALVYGSVVTFGPVRLIDDRAEKTWFFDRVLEKYGDPAWVFEPGYPQIDRIVLYEQTIEIITGKRSPGHSH